MRFKWKLGNTIVPTISNMTNNQICFWIENRTCGHTDIRDSAFDAELCGLCIQAQIATSLNKIAKNCVMQNKQ